MPKTCRWCAEEMKDAAIVCPHCTRPQKTVWIRVGVLWFVLILMFIAVWMTFQPKR
jgi:hypothetical protein